MLSPLRNVAPPSSVPSRPRGRAGFTRIASTASRCKTSGFTLIELLVVIAIIAILAAILFPVFAQAREKARQAKCLSNCKQIGLALMQYTQDYDETYPVNNWTYGKSWQGCQLGWMQHLQGYMKNAEVFVCPDSVFNDPTNGNQYTTIPGVNGASAGSLTVPIRDLGANEWVVSSVSSGTPSISWKGNINMAQIGRPADLPMVADSTFGTFIDAARIMNPNWVDPAHANYWWTYPVVPTPQLSRHSGGSTIVYGDGHAKWMNQNAMQWDSTLIQQNNNTPCPATPQYNNPWCWKLPLHPADKRLQ